MQLTRGDPVVVRRRPLREDVLHLEELVGSVAADDGEPEALRAFSEGRLQDGAVQLGRVPREAPPPPGRLLCLGRRWRERRVTTDSPALKLGFYITFKSH